MLITRQLMHWVGAFALAMMIGGCQSPWLTASDAPPAPAAKAVANSTAGAARGRAPTAASHNSDQTSPVATEAAMAGVMDKLQQVSDLDPSATPRLLAQLQNTPPEFWPATAEQFRASLAYHQELVAREGRDGREGESTAGRERTMPPAPRGTADVGDEPREPQTIEHSAAGEPAAPRSTNSTRPLNSPLQESTVSSPGRLGGAAPGKSQPDPRTANGVNRPTKFDVVPASHVAMPGTAGSGRTAPSMQGTEDETRATSAINSDGPGNTSATSAATGDWREQIKLAADDLERRVAESPASTAEIHQHVTLRMLRLFAGETDRALEPIPHISPVEQDYWSRQMFALATYLDHHSQPDDKRRAAAGAIQLDEALAHLRDAGSLSLRNLTFCKKVFGYGAYDAYEETRFAPGQPVTLYVEVENYHCESTDKGFTTMLGSSYELLDEAGKRVAGDTFPDVDDTCRSRRRDFHIQYTLTLPPKIAPGKYRLQIVVRDRQSDKIGNSTVAFEVGGSKGREPRVDSQMPGS